MSGGATRGSVFQTTRWSAVCEAARAGPGRLEGAPREALEDLAGAYWYPLFALARRRGAGPEEAADLVQGYFARLVEKRDLAAVDPRKGRFRAFLAVSFRNFTANERDRATARKRGGDVRHVPLDVAQAERRFADDGDGSAPDLGFDRDFALTLLDRVRDTLEQEHARADRRSEFARLEPFLVAGGADYEALAQDEGTTEVAIRVRLHRLRRQFAEVLRREVAAVVRDPEDVDAELAALRRAIGPEIGGNPETA